VEVRYFLQTVSLPSTLLENIMSGLVILVQFTAAFTAGIILLACLAGAVKSQARRRRFNVRRSYQTSNLPRSISKSRNVAGKDYGSNHSAARSMVTKSSVPNHRPLQPETIETVRKAVG
jgi:hypothetical protein